MSKTNSDYLQEARGISLLMEGLQKTLSKFRIEEAEAKIAYETLKSDAEKLVTPIMIRIAEEIGQEVDPRTGKTNEKWATMLMQSRLMEDPLFVELSKKGKEAEDAYYMAQVKTQDVADQLGTLRSRAYLHASMLNYISAHQDDDD